MTDFCEDWLWAKAAELAAVEARRAIEDRMLASGQTKWPGYAVRIAHRDNWKVDGDEVQRVAAAHGLSDHLSHLFRWKPEVNRKAWDAADETITRPLLQAITISPGRPSFTITKE